MKKSHANSFFALALFVMGIFVFKTATANEIEVAIIPATNCAYTGSSSDECYASDGKNNYIVSNCRPGSTSCGFNPQ
jgi:hypothetical protein